MDGMVLVGRAGCNPAFEEFDSPTVLFGSLAEWIKASVLKTEVRWEAHRGFESYSFCGLVVNRL